MQCFNFHLRGLWRFLKGRILIKRKKARLDDHKTPAGLGRPQALPQIMTSASPARDELAGLGQVRGLGELQAKLRAMAYSEVRGVLLLGR